MIRSSSRSAVTPDGLHEPWSGYRDMPMQKRRTAARAEAERPTGDVPRPWSPFSPPSGDRRPDPDASGLLIQSVVPLLEEHGRIGFWWHDVATDAITVSPGFARLTGVPLAVPHTRDSMMSLIHPQDRPSQEDQIGLMRSGQPLRREFRILRPDETLRWVSSRIDVVLDEGGRPRRFIGVVVDITERREAQQAAEYSHGRRAALLEAVSALTWTTDLSGRSKDTSAWLTLTGLTFDQCRGDGWLDAVHPDDRDHVRDAYRSALEQVSPYRADFRIRTPEGRYRRYMARSAVVRDPSGLEREWQGVLLPLDGDSRHPRGEAGDDDAAALTGDHIRGARGLLDWSLAQLAAASGVSVSTLKRMEDGSEGSTRASKADAVRRALQGAGIVFRAIDGATWIGR